MNLRKNFIIIAGLFFAGSAFLYAQGAGGERERSGGAPDRGFSERAPARPEKPARPSRDSDSSDLSRIKNTQSFNGMRISSEHEPFQVVLISADEKSITVIFNIPINPGTFRKTNIFINGVSLDTFDKKAQIRFNKTGKVVEIRTALPADFESTLEFSGARSFDNSTLAIANFLSIKPGFNREYPKISDAEIQLNKEEKSE